MGAFNYKNKIMIIDERVQRRKITIDFTLMEYKYPLDNIIDELLPSLKTVIEQRKLHGTIVKIILK